VSSSTNINQRNHVPYQAGSMIGSIKASTNQKNDERLCLTLERQGDIIGGIKTSANQKGKMMKGYALPSKRQERSVLG